MVQKIKKLYETLSQREVSLRDAIGMTVTLSALLLFSSLYTACSFDRAVTVLRSEREHIEYLDTGKLLDEINRLRIIVDERLPKQAAAEKPATD